MGLDPKWCDSCGHVHAGKELASICIGCPCPKRPGVRSNLDALTEAQDKAGADDEPEPVKVLPGQRRLF